MKLTIRKKESYTVCRNYYFEEVVDIDPLLLEEIENGLHPDYESVEEWAEDQDIDFDNDNLVDEDEPYSELDDTEFEVDYSWEEETAE